MEERTASTGWGIVVTEVTMHEARLLRLFRLSALLG